MSQSLLAVLALATGAMIPLQLAFNGQLGQSLRSTYAGAFYVFVVGLFAVAIIMVVANERWPRPADLANVPATAWLGGLIAAIYIVAVVFLVPRLGVGSTAVIIIAGQIIAAMVMDHFGAFGTPESPVTVARFGGASMVLFGAAIVKFA